MTDYLVLYALCRRDLASMKEGKTIAQAMHAQAMFDKYEIVKPLKMGREPNEDVMAWHEAADGFGTTLSIAIPNLRVMERIVEVAIELGFPAGIATDPSYPFHVDNEIVNRLDQTLLTMPTVSAGPGRSVCFIEEKTIGYLFGWKSKLAVLLGHFNLVPNE